MDRSAGLELIARKYFAQFGATPKLNYPEVRMQECGGKASAALGFRRASGGPLFLEAYLDASIEVVLRNRLGRTIARHNIIEIGNLATESAPAVIALWAKTANDLGGEAEIAVAVLTAPLRAMFGRLGVRIYELVAAQPHRIADANLHWGDYYQQDPIVCAGLITDGQARLSRFAHRLASKCA